MSSENLHVETVQQRPRAYSCDLVTLNENTTCSGARSNLYLNPSLLHCVILILHINESFCVI